MNNKNTNNLIFGFLALSFLVFSAFLSPTTTEAYTAKGSYRYCDGVCSGSNSTNTTGNTNTSSNFNPNVLDKNTVPTIYSTNPEEAYTGDNLKTITIYGTGFKPDSIARWNSQDRPTTFVSANQLKIRLDAVDTKTPGKYMVTVVNPSPEGGKFSNPKVVTLLEGKTGTVLGSSTQTKASGTTKGAYTTKTNTVTKKTPVKTVAKKEEPKKVAVAENTNCLASATTNDNDSNTNLTANASNSVKSFMPNSFLGWLMLFVLIFLGVLIFRRLWVTDREVNQPLKHA